MKLIGILLFGGLGSLARYALDLSLNRNDGRPVATLVVNALGCLLIGFVYVLSREKEWIRPEWTLIITTGLLGGFTTYSAFALQTVGYAEAGEWKWVGLWLISGLICIVAAKLGMSVGRIF